MAVVSLDLNNLNLETYPEAYEKLVDALNERIALLKAFGYDNSFGDGGAGNLFYGVSYTTSYIPCGPMNKFEPNEADKMNSLMRAIRNLATRFINPDDVEFQLSYTDFPHNYLSELKKQSDEHSIGHCVGRTQTFDPETMTDWKQIFVEAAYWLNKMTMVRVPSNWDYRHTTESTSDNSYNEKPLEYAIVPQPVDPLFSNHDAYINLEYHKKQNHTEANPTITKRWDCMTGLTIVNRAPWDGVCKLYLCCPHFEATGERWDGVFPAGRRVLRRNWNQPQKWQYLERDMEVCDGAYQPDPQDDPDKYWYTNKLEVKETEVLTDNGEWTEKKIDRTESVFSGGSDNYRLSRTTTQFEKNFNHDASEEVLLTSESTTEGPDQYDTSHGSPVNNLTVNCYNIWDGLGLTDAISTPIEEAIPAHTEKKLTCFSFTQIPEPTPDFDSFVGSDWQRGNFDWHEEVIVSYDLRVIPIMDYSESLTTFTIAEPPEPGE